MAVIVFAKGELDSAMGRIPFRVSARAARLIGRENVATSQGAVTELAKNSYDADARACVILFLRRHATAPASLSAAATQRPITLSALGEPSRTATWKTLPSYVIYGTADRNIPAAVMQFMAKRAHARKTVAVEGASHAVMLSHPDDVAVLIENAANAD
ncbi:MAG: alpha/beta hydrolase [Sphingomonas bacterium]